MSAVFFVLQAMTQTKVVNVEYDTVYSNAMHPDRPNELQKQIISCTTSVGYVDENNLPTGKWDYFCCGQAYCQEVDSGSLLAQVYYSHGEFDGYYTSYYPNGNMRSRFRFDVGYLTEEFYCYLPTGVLIYEGHIQVGEEQVEGKEYRPSGSLKRERNFLLETLKRDWITPIE